MLPLLFIGITGQLRQSIEASWFRGWLEFPARRTFESQSPLRGFGSLEIGLLLDDLVNSVKRVSVFRTCCGLPPFFFLSFFRYFYGIDVRLRVFFCREAIYCRFYKYPTIVPFLNILVARKIKLLASYFSQNYRKFIKNYIKDHFNYPIPKNTRKFVENKYGTKSSNPVERSNKPSIQSCAN